MSSVHFGASRCRSVRSSWAVLEDQRGQLAAPWLPARLLEWRAPTLPSQANRDLLAVAFVAAAVAAVAAADTADVAAVAAAAAVAAVPPPAAAAAAVAQTPA